MKSSDTILSFIRKNCSPSDIETAVQKGIAPGIHAGQIQEELGMIRNNASTLLNQLHKANALIKINSRPVSFIAYDIFQDFRQNHNLEVKDSYSLKEIVSAPSIVEKPDRDPFDHLLGKNGSLANQISQAKAAIVYPPKGLHTLILGASGVGKTTFAATMHGYGMHVHNKTAETFPFVTFNCADYFNNPQLLLAQLFGHTKSAFTGANQDKVGLVEKANGGILFLDEIHRLPPDGQEMLFYLMDKGEYSRLGESSAKHKANLLIIGATTEKPEDNLLATFMRRIPVTIQLPAFEQKPIAERIEIIEHFFHYEAINLNRSISLAPETLKALAVYDFANGNIGQLRSEIKLLCAKAFLQYLQDNQPIQIGFSLLNKEIKAGIFAFDKLDSKTKQYLNMFAENIPISPDKLRRHDPLEIPTNLYDEMSNKLSDLQQKGMNKSDIHEVLAKDVNDYFSRILKNFHNDPVDIHTLYKIIPKEVVDFTAELVDFAQHHLAGKFKNQFIFGLCFHIHTLLHRLNTNPILPLPQLSQIRCDHPKEFQIAQEMVKKLEQKFSAVIPTYEQGFLALLLAQNKADAVSQDRIGIIIICHGDSTASSIASVANTLLNTNWMKAIDMPLTTTINETYDKVRSMAISINRNKGILLLVDMGSLVDFGHRLMEDTGIPARVIDSISTPAALELLRKILYKTEDLTTLYHSCNIAKHTQARSAAKKPAILAVCITGQGSSLMVKEILEKMLPDSYRQKFAIVVADYLTVQKNYPDMKDIYEFAAVIGNIDPQIDLPYYPVGQLLDPDAQKEFFNLLDIQAATIPLISSSDTYNKAQSLLEQYVKYVNPKLALKHIKGFIEAIHFAPPKDDSLLDLIIHLGCMLDRCLHKDAIYFDNIRLFQQENESLFGIVRTAADELANHYDTKINDDEVCYIVKIIKPKN